MSFKDGSRFSRIPNEVLEDLQEVTTGWFVLEPVYKIITYSGMPFLYLFSEDGGAWLYFHVPDFILDDYNFDIWQMVIEVIRASKTPIQGE